MCGYDVLRRTFYLDKNSFVAKFGGGKNDARKVVVVVES